MPQRIFDVNNPQEIFDLFPDYVVGISKLADFDKCWLHYKDGVKSAVPLKINWRNKTEITRPVDETQWIGKLCWFWNKNKQLFIAVLKEIMPKLCYKYTTANGESYEYCRPARRDEVQFADDAESKE